MKSKKLRISGFLGFTTSIKVLHLKTRESISRFRSMSIMKNYPKYDIWKIILWFGFYFLGDKKYTQEIGTPKIKKIK